MSDGEFVYKSDLEKTPLAEILATVTRYGVPGVLEVEHGLLAAAQALQQLTHGAPPPWRLHIASAQWDLALFGIMVGGQLAAAGQGGGRT